MVSFLILLKSLHVNILKQYYSPQAQLILLNNINFAFSEQLLSINQQIKLVNIDNID